MAETAAALLLLLGSLIALVAAIGVMRLPDAFLRMHAATKAGVVGAGLILLAVGLLFDSGGGWLRVGLIIAFLLVTVPLSSHALGRAAYVGGAPMWKDTRVDELAALLPRGAIDAEPPRRGVEAPPLPPPRPPGAPRRLLLALAEGEGAGATLEGARRLLARPGDEVTVLSLLCTPSLARSGPVPLGGAHHARRRAERRLDEARDAVAMLATRITAGCEAEGLDFRARHEEGDAARLLAEAAAQQDVIVMPRGAWFDQAQVLAPGEAARRAAELGLPGTLLATPDFAPPARLHFLHEGDAASTEALRRFLALGLFPEAPLEISVLDVVGGVELAEAARQMALAAGRSVPPLGPALPAERAPLLDAFTGTTLAVIPARSVEGHGAWRALRDMAAPVFLA